MLLDVTRKKKGFFGQIDWKMMRQSGNSFNKLIFPNFQLLLVEHLGMLVFLLKHFGKSYLHNLSLTMKLFNIHRPPQKYRSCAEKHLIIKRAARLGLLRIKSQVRKLNIYYRWEINSEPMPKHWRHCGSFLLETF